MSHPNKLWTHRTDNTQTHWYHTFESQWSLIRQAYARARTHTHSRVQSLISTQTHARMCIHTHMRARAYTRSHKHTHTHTHTHAEFNQYTNRTLSLSLSLSLSAYTNKEEADQTWQARGRERLPHMQMNTSCERERGFWKSIGWITFTGGWRQSRSSQRWCCLCARGRLTWTTQWQSHEKGKGSEGGGGGGGRQRDIKYSSRTLLQQLVHTLSLRQEHRQFPTHFTGSTNESFPLRGTGEIFKNHSTSKVSQTLTATVVQWLSWGFWFSGEIREKNNFDRTHTAVEVYEIYSVVKFDSQGFTL